MQVAGLVRDNDKTLGPALTQLTKVTKILSSNRKNLDGALRLIGPYYSLLSDATGSGQWVDIYLCGLFTKSGTPVLGGGRNREAQLPPDERELSAMVMSSLRARRRPVVTALVLVVVLVVVGGVWWVARTPLGDYTFAASSPLPSASTRATTSASSASRSARSTR